MRRVVHRYRLDGALDTSFATDGTKQIEQDPGGVEAAFPRNTLRLPNGKVCVTGNQNFGGGTFGNIICVWP